jgi:probable F420-dependent oxidoreductase
VSLNIGISIRNMGHQSMPATMAEIAVAADQASLHSLWVTDHIAIPADDAEGSGGRYVDPLATLAWLAGQTRQIKLGTGVLILPYREALPTAKWVASVQELSGERLLLGVGIGWMRAEFQAIGKSRKHRVRDSETVLRFLHNCFAEDEVSLNGQSFLFKPRPARPPVYIGGSAPHAVDRALSLGDGWMPMGPLPGLVPQISDYQARAREMGKPCDVVAFTQLPSRPDSNALGDLFAEYETAGVTTLVVSRKYETADQWLSSIDILAKAKG